MASPLGASHWSGSKMEMNSLTSKLLWTPKEKAPPTISPAQPRWCWELGTYTLRLSARCPMSLWKEVLFLGLPTCLTSSEVNNSESLLKLISVQNGLFQSSQQPFMHKVGIIDYDQYIKEIVFILTEEIIAVLIMGHTPISFHFYAFYGCYCFPSAPGIYAFWFHFLWHSACATTC